MKTYYMGRFAIDLPEEFKVEYRSQKVRYAEVFDFKWKEKDRNREMETLWAEKIAKIKKLQLPKGRKKIILEEKELKNIGQRAKAIVYYGDQYAPNCTYWTILADYGNTGMWLTLDGEDDDLSIKNFTNILNHYRYGFNDLSKNSFCLNYGRIDLPYMEQERIYTRFAGPMEMKLEVEVKEIHQANKEGIISRTTTAMEAGLASGLKIEKIRSQKRIAAGLGGEEEILQGDEGGEKHLSFDWEYLGTVDSGEKPWIQITVDTGQDHLNEKIQIWDAALESFRPASKR